MTLWKEKAPLIFRFVVQQQGSGKFNYRENSHNSSSQNSQVFPTPSLFWVKVASERPPPVSLFSKKCEEDLAETQSKKKFVFSRKQCEFT